jgi:hypothetical protein
VLTGKAALSPQMAERIEAMSAGRDGRASGDEIG